MNLRMYNPPHPGEVLLGLHMEPAGLTVTTVAKRIGVDRKTLSRLIHGRTSITVEMAMRLGKAFHTTPNLWLGLQQEYDLWQAEHEHKIDLSKIKPFSIDETEQQPRT